MSAPIWQQVIGHDQVIRRLDAEVAAGRTAQAYLFCGPGEVGKTMVARGLAQRLLCQASEGQPCGQCDGCRQVARDVPTVIQTIRPEVSGGKQPFRPRLHRVAAIRDWLGEVALRGAGGSHRVYILVGAEYLRDEAANTILKTLEEPPAGVTIVLTSEQPAALLPTILSRVRRVEFAPVPSALIEDWLLSQAEVTAAGARTAARLAAGRPGRALALAGDPTARQVRERVVTWASRLRAQPAAAALLAAEQFLAGAVADPEAKAEDSAEEPANGVEGREVELALELLEWWLRDALVTAATGDASRVVNQDRLEAVDRTAGRYTSEELCQSLRALQQARRCLQRNGNPQLVLEVLWLRLARGGRAAGR